MTYVLETSPFVMVTDANAQAVPAWAKAGASFERKGMEQLQQSRAILGALQWRVYQPAPQHGARLSMLQSQLAHPTIGAIRETNKLVREVVHGRDVGLKYYKLLVDDLSQVTFVA